MALELVPREPRRARGAVGLADEVLGTRPARVARAVQADEFAHALEVALVVVEFRHLLAGDHAAVAGADRVDEHEVRAVQQRMLVVDQPPRRRRRVALVVQLHAPRSQQAQVQPHRARARAAVERKRDGARFRLGAVEGVGHEEDARPRLVGLGLALLLALLLEDEGAAGHGVGDVPARESHAVAGDDHLVGRWRLLGGLLLLFGVWFRHRDHPLFERGGHRNRRARRARRTAASPSAGRYDGRAAAAPR